MNTIQKRQHYYWLGRNHEEKGNLHEAIEAYKNYSIVLDDQDKYIAHFCIAKLYNKLGMQQEAMHHTELYSKNGETKKVNEISETKRADKTSSFNFPELPEAKLYENRMTPEQIATFKLVQRKPLTQEDENALKAAIDFYDKAFQYLKSINLSIINERQRDEIIEYLSKIFNLQIVFQNGIQFESVYRVTFVKDDFLENGKVRNIKHISYPPLEIIKKLDRYGRVNTPNSTYFYCSFSPVIALLETKPNIGDRIIITQWVKDDDDSFITHPLAIGSLPNENSKAASKAFKERMSYNNDLFATILEKITEFLTSEFAKNSPVVSDKGYEYLYSSYFGDSILGRIVDHVPHPTEPIFDYDCIIYPSIAGKHLADNLAIKPTSVKRLRPFYLEESIVEKTMYEMAKITNDVIDVLDLPIGRRVLRISNKIEEGKIIWDDDASKDNIDH